MMMLNERMHFHELIRSLVLLCKITRPTCEGQFELGKDIINYFQTAYFSGGGLIMYSPIPFIIGGGSNHTPCPQDRRPWSVV